MHVHNLVVGGDLNFSLGLSETWGPQAHVDPLADFFLNKIKDGRLIDINIIKNTPTWRNRRVGEARVAKRLDCFLINEAFVNGNIVFKQWVGSGGESDHFPILMELSGPNKKLESPFKFNLGWHKDPSFIRLVKDTWRSMETYLMHNLSWRTLKD